MLDKVYIDASFFIATQIKNHPFHKDALKVLKKLVDNQLFFSLLTIDEIIYGLGKYKLRRKKISQIIEEKILPIEHVELISYGQHLDEIERYLNLWVDTKLKPRDALHLFFMRKAEIAYIATYDEDFIDQQRELKINVVS